MITSTELRLIDDHFQQLASNAFCLTLRSRCTGHEWHILLQEYDRPHFRSFLIYHRHKHSDDFHAHGHAGTLAAAIESIKGHDEYQLHKKGLR